MCISPPAPPGLCTYAACHAYSSPPRRHAASTHVPPSALLCQLWPRFSSTNPPSSPFASFVPELPLLSYFSTYSVSDAAIYWAAGSNRRCCDTY
ncbi:hypothetical protein TgHK011_006037 [Trichoderma gracile]|nr:hypothetical protein TgHK011_006037 [Trichoderma gracile]